MMNILIRMSVFEGFEGGKRKDLKQVLMMLSLKSNQGRIRLIEPRMFVRQPSLIWSGDGLGGEIGSGDDMISLLFQAITPIPQSGLTTILEW